MIYDIILCMIDSENNKDRSDTIICFIDRHALNYLVLIGNRKSIYHAYHCILSWTRFCYTILYSLRQKVIDIGT